jgi:hypothetical protein
MPTDLQLQQNLECVELFAYSTILYPKLQQREHFNISINTYFTGSTQAGTIL